MDIHVHVEHRFSAIDPEALVRALADVRVQKRIAEILADAARVGRPPRVPRDRG